MANYVAAAFQLRNAYYASTSWVLYVILGLLGCLFLYGVYLFITSFTSRKTLPTTKPGEKPKKEPALYWPSFVVMGAALLFALIIWLAARFGSNPADKLRGMIYNDAR